MYCLFLCVSVDDFAFVTLVTLINFCHPFASDGSRDKDQLVKFLVLKCIQYILLKWPLINMI